MERIPTRIKWKIHFLFTLYFKFWRYFLCIKICRIQPLVLLFLVVFHINQTSLNISEMFQVKSRQRYNVNLILIWPHRHFLQQKNVNMYGFPKNTGVEILRTNALPVYHHQICLYFKHRYLKSWKMCCWY